jgi:Co/Zn/Cd efflux system component
MFRALFSYLDLRRTVLLVAALNFFYFVIEFTYGRLYNSLALISDSIDFLEDASVNLLVVLALGWSIAKRKYVSYLLAGLLLVPGIAFLWNAINKLLDPVTPVGEAMTFVGLGALLINVFCALLIARHKSEEHGLVLAAYYSARNDAIGNVLIIISGLITLVSPSIWPDLLVGLLIFTLNAGAAKSVISASKADEQKSQS